MDFNSIGFLLIFLPIVWIIFINIKQDLRILVLLISSLIFYSISGIIPLIFMIIAILIGFYVAMLKKIKTKLYLFLSIFPPLMILFLFKYLNFSLNIIDAGSETRNFFYFFLSVTLPAGISFYTFQIMSYSMDVYSKKIKKEQNFIKLATYISLFPQLIAGPILRYSQMVKQLNNIVINKKLEIDYKNAFKYLSFGLAGKVFVSDLMNLLIKNKNAYDISIDASKLDIFFLINAYSIRIFFDFWAYSLMAIGIAKLFSLDLPINFREPYQTKNPKDFWRRWHITLSLWLRDYVYIKLGGNKNYTKNIIIVFLVCGLWHGAGYSFIIWGAYHAILVLIYHYSKNNWNKLNSSFQILLTYLLISIGWPLFFMDITQYFEMLAVFFKQPSSTGIYSLKHWVFIIPILAWIFLSKEKNWLYNDKRNWLFDSPILHAALLFFSLIFSNYSETFIYFRF